MFLKPTFNFFSSSLVRQFYNHWGEKIRETQHLSILRNFVLIDNQKPAQQ